MTKMFRTAAAGVALFAAVGMGTAAHAQDSATADARAEILAALQLVNNGDLDFGAIVVNTGVGGTVTVATDNSRACSGVICGPASSESAADFNITGASGTEISITLQDLTTTPVSLRHQGNLASGAAEHNIELTSLVDSLGGADTSFDGDEDFTVGGTITLDGSEIAGVYVGQFDVSVAYQ